MTTCPRDIAWCTHTHRDDTTVHYGPLSGHADTTGGVLNVSAQFDDETGRHTVWVGDHEFDLDEASDVVAAISRAMNLPVLAVTR